eukprot:9477291-Pyramimonas_sp.AAC.1
MALFMLPICPPPARARTTGCAVKLLHACADGTGCAVDVKGCDVDVKGCDADRINSQIDHRPLRPYRAILSLSRGFDSPVNSSRASNAEVKRPFASHLREPHRAEGVPVVLGGAAKAAEHGH